MTNLVVSEGYDKELIDDTLDQYLRSTEGESIWKKRNTLKIFYFERGGGDSQILSRCPTW